MSQKLNLNAIKNQLQSQRKLALEIFSELDSTNNYLQTKSITTANDIYICLAEAQTHGRGRENKLWVSPANCNLYLSLLWPTTKNLSELSGLSLSIGISVATILNLIIKQYSNHQCKIKWPNDIYWQDKKIAGILLETFPAKNNLTAVIIGIGININMQKALAEISQAWTSLKNICQTDFDRNVIAANLIDNLLNVLSTFQNNGFAPFHKIWPQYDYLAGKFVSNLTQNSGVSGKVIGVNERGNLLITTATKKIIAIN